MARRQTQRAAIVSTMRAPGRDLLADWLAYHRAIGFTRFYLYFDDPADADADTVAAASDVRVRRRDATLVRELAAGALWSEVGAIATAGHGGDRTMAWQVLHVEHALAAIRAERAGADWLLHIDHDELFATPGDDAPAHFAALAELGTDQAVYLNHEAVPETLEVEAVFRDVTLFKRNPAVVERLRGRRAAATAQRRFLAYARGKAAVRVAAAPRPAGVHRFVGTGAPLATRVLEAPCILHYPACGFARWRAKYDQLGDFADRWADGTPIGLRFHLASRDLRAAPLAIARRYYRERALLGGRAARDRLTRSGVLIRIRGPSRILARRRRATRSPKQRRE